MSKRTDSIMSMLKAGVSKDYIKKLYGLSSSRLSDIIREAEARRAREEKFTIEYPDFVGLSGTVARALIYRLGCTTKASAREAFLSGQLRDVPLIGNARYNEIATWLGLLPEIKKSACPYCGKIL